MTDPRLVGVWAGALFMLALIVCLLVLFWLYPPEKS